MVSWIEASNLDGTVKRWIACLDALQIFRLKEIETRRFPAALKSPLHSQQRQSPIRFSPRQCGQNLGGSHIQLAFEKIIVGLHSVSAKYCAHRVFHVGVWRDGAWVFEQIVPFRWVPEEDAVVTVKNKVNEGRVLFGGFRPWPWGFELISEIRLFDRRSLRC